MLRGKNRISSSSTNKFFRKEIRILWWNVYFCMIEKFIRKIISFAVFCAFILQKVSFKIIDSFSYLKSEWEISSDCKRMRTNTCFVFFYIRIIKEFYWKGEIPCENCKSDIENCKILNFKVHIFFSEMFNKTSLY